MPGPTLANLSTVPASVTSVGILSSNLSRVAALVYNDSSSNMFLAFAPSASSSSYSVKLGPGSLYEGFPSGYQGSVSAIWESATGNARITEVINE